MAKELDTFTLAYIECALWSSTGDDGEPLDGIGAQLAPQTLARMVADCEAFRDDAKIATCIGHRDAEAGHDFWLTRNGHGAGFWDGDWEEPDSDYLDMQATRFGSADLYVGDDGLIYQCGAE